MVRDINKSRKIDPQAEDGWSDEPTFFKTESGALKDLTIAFRVCSSSLYGQTARGINNSNKTDPHKSKVVN